MGIDRFEESAMNSRNARLHEAQVRELTRLLSASTLDCHDD
jgi:hypothetical protein